MNKFLKAFLDIFFSPKCVICSKLEEKFLCENCINTISKIEKPICQFCGKPALRSVDRCIECRDEKLYFIKARSFGLYETVLKDAIVEFKYNHIKSLTEVLAQLLYKVYQKNYENDLFNSIEFIPMTRKDKNLRGFNQSELLAKKLAKMTKIPVNGFLIKVRNTESQMGLQLSQRRKNLVGAFNFQGDKGKCGSNILLIDDVYTTGYTVSECSKVLLKNGAKNVYILTLARSILM